MSKMTTSEKLNPDADLLNQVTHIVSAYVSNNAVAGVDIAGLISDTHKALKSLSPSFVGPDAEALIPAVPIKKSLTPDFIVCLDDGKKFKSMKRHLSQLGMTPAEYRAKWGLPDSYPMVAPNYSAKRSSLAKSNSLGRKLAEPPLVSAKRTRKPKADA